MSFSDPQVITINGVTHDLNSVSVNGSETVYQKADGTMTLRVSHTESGRRLRRLFGFSQKVIATDPLGGVSEQTLNVNIIVDEPKSGDWAFNDTYVGQVIEGVKSRFDTTTQGKFLGGQH